MGKNVLIAVLAVGLVGSVGLFLRSCWSAAVMRAAQHNLMVSGNKVWNNACVHAAGGDRARLRWCALADQETAKTAAEDGVGVEEQTALATDQVTVH